MDHSTENFQKEEGDRHKISAKYSISFKFNQLPIPTDYRANNEPKYIVK